MHRVTPYDTGKVKIGCHYEPPRFNAMSGDMERLQSALLGHRGPRLDIDVRQVLEIASYAVSGVLACIVLLISYAPK